MLRLRQPQGHPSTLSVGEACSYGEAGKVRKESTLLWVSFGVSTSIRLDDRLLAVLVEPVTDRTGDHRSPGRSKTGFHRAIESFNDRFVQPCSDRNTHNATVSRRVRMYCIHLGSRSLRGERDVPLVLVAQRTSRRVAGTPP